MEVERGEPGGRRAVHRSPKYPGLTFADALERIQVIYSHDRRTPARPETVLGHIGLRAGSGTANRILSALKQYGLLEEQEDGKVKVSEPAYRILELSDESPERISLIHEAALRPGIIQEVIQTFPDGLPSDATLGDYLKVEKNFNPDAVSFFIRVVRENLAVTKAVSGSRESAAIPSGGPSEGRALDESPRLSTSPLLPPPGMALHRADGGADMSDPYNYPLSTDCLGIVRFRGQPTQADVQRLIDFLSLSKLAFPESSETGKRE